MFQFGKSDQNGEIPYITGFCQDYPVYRQNVQTEDQRTLQVLKVQVNYLATEMTDMKATLRDFISDVKGRLDTINDSVSHLQAASQIEKPKKKFKKAINCPVDDCGKRYSSKIALNCHIRTKHKRNRVQQ